MSVRPFGFLFDETVFLTEEKHKTLRNGTLELDDVVITTRGTLGNVAVYDETVPYKIVRINSGMLILRNKGTEVINQFLKFYIASPLFFVQLNKKQSGSAQPQIPAGILKTFVIPLPPVEEQHEIVRRVETLFAYADHLEARYTAARAQVERLTPALLAKAFRGELVSQDSNDEPASVLLERIRAARAAAGETADSKRRKGSCRPKASQQGELLILTRNDIQDTHMTPTPSASSASSRRSSC
jgi:type I restriction enzyme S subunit